MLDKNGDYHSNDKSEENERLYRILDKLNSIRKHSQVRGDSEQFILGILLSTDIVTAEIRGEIHKIDGSTTHPDQIPLI
jgi:hypothetical protein